MSKIKELEKEISKDAGETSFYLEKDRKYIKQI